MAERGPRRRGAARLGSEKARRRLRRPAFVARLVARPLQITRREAAAQRAVHPRAEPLLRTSIRSSWRSTVWQARARAPVHGEGEPVPDPGARLVPPHLGQVPVRARRHAARCVPMRTPRSIVDEGRCVDRLPGGHAHARPGHLADARQDRRRAAGARPRHPRHPRGALGHAGAHAALRQEDQLRFPRKTGSTSLFGDPVDLSTFARTGRATDPAALQAGDRRHHGGDHAGCSRSFAARRRPPTAGIRPSTARRRRVALSRRSDAARPARRRARRRQLGHHLRRRSSPTAAPTSPSGRAARSSPTRSTRRKRNSDYLPGINLPAGPAATRRWPRRSRDAEQVFLSIPSQTARGRTSRRCAPLARRHRRADRRQPHEGRREAAPACA